MGAEFEDRTGQPPTVREIEESIAIVRKCLVMPDMLLKLPPELGVQMLSIMHQLQLLQGLMVQVEILKALFGKR